MADNDNTLTPGAAIDIAVAAGLTLADGESIYRLAKDADDPVATATDYAARASAPTAKAESAALADDILGRY